MPQENLLPGTWADFAASLLAVPPPLPPPRGKAGRQVAPVRDPASRRRAAADAAGGRAVGRVKIGHTSPTRDFRQASPPCSCWPTTTCSRRRRWLLRRRWSRRQQARHRMGASLRRFLPGQADCPGIESVFDAQRIALRRWLRRCEGGLDLPPRSARQLTASLFNVGPSLYDGVITYEHLALPHLDRVDAHAASLGRLVLFTPIQRWWRVTPPSCFWGSADLFGLPLERWLRFLLSKPMQEAAIDAGFRPVGSEVSLRSYESVNNRFLSLRRYGVIVQPVLREAPRIRGKTAQSLIELWEK